MLLALFSCFFFLVCHGPCSCNIIGNAGTVSLLPENVDYEKKVSISLGLHNSTVEPDIDTP